MTTVPRTVTVRVRDAFVDRVPRQFTPLLDSAALATLEARAKAAQRQPSRELMGYQPPPAPTTLATGAAPPQPRALPLVTDAAFRLRRSYSVEVPPGVDPQAFADVLRQWEGTDEAYVAPHLALPAAGSGPGGAEPAWWEALGVPRKRRPTGKGVSFVDLEWGHADHEDLPRVATVHGDNHGFWWHGNAVLGLLVGQGKGVRGLAPRATAKFASPWTSQGYDLLGAIAGAAAHLERGDVLLLEVQARCGDQTGLPVEVDPAVQDLLALLRHAEIVVVEAAGNGGHNLDQVCVVGRGPGRVGDSGAILVGAYRRDGEARLPSSNYGSRVSMWAWGEGVASAWSNPLGTAPDAYVDDFRGTSAAAAIVAGVVVAVQSRAKVRYCWGLVPRPNPPLTPERMEKCLYENGRSVADGWFPNLGACLQALP